VEGKINTKALFFSWWYGEAFSRLLGFIGHFYVYLFDLFSVKVSMATIFAPWKRDQISYENLSLQEQFQVWLLNLSSRFVGFWVKLFTVLTCLVCSALFTIIAGCTIIFWLGYPAILFVLIYIGLKLVFGV